MEETMNTKGENTTKVLYVNTVELGHLQLQSPL